MRRELGIARCGLACCLCGLDCAGCYSEACQGRDWCENRKCSQEKALAGCYSCDEPCHKGLLAKPKPAGFRLFAQRYGVETLLDCLERNEQAGIVYHRDGISGDYDGFEDVEALVAFIKTGKKTQ